MTRYTIEDLKIISDTQLSPVYYNRALDALNGLAEIFDKEWVEKEFVAYYITKEDIIEQVGYDKKYSGISDLEKLIFLYEDLQLLKGFAGYDKYLKKLMRGGIRGADVDLEISTIADITRTGGLNIQLEPPVGDKEADGCFQTNDSEDLIYLEVSRVKDPRTNNDIDNKGEQLAQSLSGINPSRRCILVIKTELDNEIYDSLLRWIETKPTEGDFENIATFFTVPHNTDASSFALQYYNNTNLIISVRQGYGNIIDNSFGEVYLYKSDPGAMKKIEMKSKQLPTTNKNILILDITKLPGGFPDWEKQIIFTQEINHLSCVILVRDSISSSGWNRDVRIIVNQNSVNLLTKEQLDFLARFSSIRRNKNLMN